MSDFTEPPVLNEVEKKEIRAMMLKVMRDFRDLLTESINELDGEEKFNDDSEFRTYEANQYSDFIYFYINLYEPGLNSFDAKRFWALDTGPRGCCWQTLEEELSPELFVKIEAYLTANNKHSIKKNF